MRGPPHPHDICKAGQITTNGSGVASVVFVTPLLSPAYVVCLTCEDPADTAIAMWSNKAVGGFDIKTENDQGQSEGSVTVDWIVLPYNNS